MRRGKRYLENENMFIYVGAGIFILLAIGLGVIMYMTTKTGFRIENADKFAQEQQSQIDTESVTSEIGKTVEEQQNENVEANSNPTSVEEPKQAEVVNQAPVIVDEPDTTTNAQESEPAPVPAEVTEPKKEITFIMPTEGEIICEYAKDNLVYSETLKEWITHTAIDIKADKTSVIKSAADGFVKSIVNDPRYGLTVVIEHADGYETVYSNLLTAEFVVAGEEVGQGQTIGTAGNTASFESNMECHLHFELLKDGEYLDPSIYLK